MPLGGKMNFFQYWGMILLVKLLKIRKLIKNWKSILWKLRVSQSDKESSWTVSHYSMYEDFKPNMGRDMNRSANNRTYRESTCTLHTIKKAMIVQIVNSYYYFYRMTEMYRVLDESRKKRGGKRLEHSIICRNDRLRLKRERMRVECWQSLRGLSSDQ